MYIFTLAFLPVLVYISACRVLTEGNVHFTHFYILCNLPLFRYTNCSDNSQ